MNGTTMILALVILAQPPADDGASATASAREKRERLLEFYTSEAAGYTFHRDAEHHEKLALRRKPVFVWNNVVRNNGQDGAVFVWTYGGRAEVIGTFFSLPENGLSALAPNRDLCHEFHSLSLSVLAVSRSPRANQWTPKAPGITLTPIPGAPPPARSASLRLTQMRALARDFTAKTQDSEDRHWDLRLLPQPLYRYESTDPGVLDGADFAFVTSAGTDPEAILVLEARNSEEGNAPVWHFAVARFTDLRLWVSHQGNIVFTTTFIPLNGIDQDGKDRYRVFKDRVIPASEVQR
jgi:hypothetical protein